MERAVVGEFRAASQRAKVSRVGWPFFQESSCGSGCRNAGTPGLHQRRRMQEITARQDVRFPRHIAGFQHQLRGAFGVPPPDFRNLIVFGFPLRNGGAPITKNGLHLEGSALGRRNGKDVTHVLGQRISRGARRVGNGQTEAAEIVAFSSPSRHDFAPGKWSG